MTIADTDVLIDYLVGRGEAGTVERLLRRGTLRTTVSSSARVRIRGDVSESNNLSADGGSPEATRRRVTSWLRSSTRSFQVARGARTSICPAARSRSARMAGRFWAPAAPDTRRKMIARCPIYRKLFPGLRPFQYPPFRLPAARTCFSPAYQAS